MAKRKKDGKRAASPGSQKDALVKLPDWFTNRHLQAWVLFAFAFLLYANTLSNRYALDDAIVITDNMFTTEGISGIPGILTKDTFYGFFKEEGKARLVSGGRYRPLSLVLFAVEVSLFGQQPWVGHLFNALWFGFSVVVLYWLLLRLLPVRKEPLQAFFISLAAALLFAAHPIHTEVVANIKGRDEILALLGSLSALLLSLKGYQRRQGWYTPLAGLVFFLGLMAKENAITFLAVVPLAYYFFTRAGAGAIVRQTLPFAVAALVFLLIRGAVLGWALGDPSIELMNNPFLKIEGGRYVPFSAGEKLATVIYTLGRYLQLLVVPYPLTHDYYPRHIGIMHWSDWQVWLSLLAYAGLAAYALLNIRRKDPVSFAILYFLATLSIVSNLVFPVGTNMAERLLYMPSVGFVLAAAVLLWRLAKRLSPKTPPATLEQLRPALVVGMLVVAGYSLLTIVRNPVWKDNLTLFSTDISVSPNSAKLRNALGGELVVQSASEPDSIRKEDMLREAVGHLQEAVAIHPNYKNAYLLLGNAHYYLGNYEEAIAYYRRALELAPGYAEANRNLAIALRDAGRYYGEQRQDIARALQFLEQAYQMEPRDYETVRLLGVANGLSGKIWEAIRYFTEAVALEPDNAEALYNLGSAYYNAGDPEMGAEFHRKAEALRENNK